jgi:hypothetical protein
MPRPYHVVSIVLGAYLLSVILRRGGCEGPGPLPVSACTEMAVAKLPFIG